MPFNSRTYYVNKYRRERDRHMLQARTAPDEPSVKFCVSMARCANNLLRGAIRIKAISEAPYTDFMPGGRFYEEPTQ